MKSLHINPNFRESLVRLFISFPILIVTFTLVPSGIQAQKLVRDSIVISFENPHESPVTEVLVDSIRDLRQVSPSLVGRYEVSKFLIIPVDLNITTEKPLSQEISELFNSPIGQSSSPQIRLFINEFHLSKNSGSWLFPRYLLNGAFRIYRCKPDSTVFIGEILYDVPQRPPIFGDKLKNSFQKVVYKWQQEFVTDLNTIADNLADGETPRLENFRTEAYTGKSLNLYSGTSYIRYPNSHIIDIEIFFSNREARRWSIRTGGYQLRFRNAVDFESLSLGLSRDYFFYRLKRNSVFKVKSQLMLGFNRWKDIKTIDHEIYDALILEYVLGQDIVYNVLDKRSILIGLGLQENVFYIYSKKLQLKMGFSIYLGVKL